MGHARAVPRSLARGPGRARHLLLLASGEGGPLGSVGLEAERALATLLAARSFRPMPKGRGVSLELGAERCLLRRDAQALTRPPRGAKR
jgi:hypothetical protein